MKPSIKFHRALLVAIVALLAALPLAQGAQAGSKDEPSVPGEIRVEAGNKVFLVGHAVGVQIYVCDSAAARPAWRLLAPRANLYGDNGKLIATHFAGPTWQAKDGSKVVGSRVNGVTIDPTAIPWLLLSAASRTTGPDGDRLAHTTYIQRVNTVGGLVPPAADCSAATLGVHKEVAYTADYYFWKGWR